MDGRARRILAVCSIALVATLIPGAAETAETLTQVISRENPLLDCSRCSLTVGRDGNVYLANTKGNDGFVLRISRDGKRKYGKKAVYAIANATANAEGVVATANGHFAHKVTVYDTTLEQTGELNDFLVSDSAGWDAPAHVEAGASGDLYGLDQHRDRILRMSSKARVVTNYRLPHEPAGGQGNAESFRVCEKREALYVRFRSGAIRCIGFDGTVRWECRANVAGQWYLHGTAYDVDDDGILYVIENGSDTLKRFSADGEPMPPVKLKMDGHRPPQGKVGFFALGVHGEDLIMRCEDETELFQRYDLTSGEFKQSVRIDSELLKVTFPSLVWTAGQTIPFEISFEAAGGTVRPRWRVWARPYEAAEYRELIVTRGKLEVPEDMSGLYAIKVTPETQPWRKGVAPDYIVRSFVEVRRQNATGSLTVLTPQSRVHYGAGEPIEFELVARSPRAGESVNAKVLLLDGETCIARAEAALKTGGEAARFVLNAEITSALHEGDYVLAVEAPKYTCVPQRLSIGRGVAPRAFHRVQYGDYTELYPTTDAWDAPDVVKAHADRKHKLGLDLIVDRIGCHIQVNNLVWANNDSANGLLEKLRKRLDADPLAVAPQKVLTAAPLLQTVAAYGAAGIRQMAILMYMDAGLPIGTGHDTRTPEQLKDAIRRVSMAMKPYASFRGWSWSSNWWVYGNRGSGAAKDASEKAAYENAVKEAERSGAWNPVLDTVANRRLSYAVDAQAMFNETLNSVAPDSGYKTSVAGPYRNVESYPPTTYRNVDEVDLHIQWEQVGVPYHCPHNVDFCKRPGKIGWGHPEVWNDSGTGDQILPNLMMMVMRGADGVGCSGPIPPWAGERNGLPDDPRVAHYGTASVFRALNGWLEMYGPWLSTLENDDDVAIVASGRMFRIDNWNHVTGLHFARVMEAYISCLLAHRPASIIFAEDVEQNSFDRFKAVLLVNQRVELEPDVKRALAASKRSGTKVFFDKTCRAELLEGFQPLDVAFDKIDKDHSPAGDDAAYWRFTAAAEANLPGLLEVLSPVVEPAAGLDNPEVVVSRRKSGRGRVVFVVNNTQPGLEPGHMWRVTLGLTSRVPVRLPVRLDAAGKAVYELFALKRVTPQGDAFAADLRCHPARVFVILPTAVENVQLRAEKSPVVGSPFAWQATVLDSQGNAVEASVPLRVRLLAPDGRVLREEFCAAGPKGVSGKMIVPFNTPDGNVTLEAAELLSGKCARLGVAPKAVNMPIEISEKRGGTDGF